MGVVFALHGGAGRAEQFAGYLNFDVYAKARNLLIVYPQGFERHWNDGRPDVSYSTHEGDVDDVAFLRAVLETVATRYPVDRGRVYVAGISNGGMMALRLACEAADTFAAVAALTASFPMAMADRCDPIRPLPVMLINGTDDPIFPYGGGTIGFGRRKLGEVRSTPETVARWVVLNGCLGPAKIVALPDTDRDDDSRVVVERYLPCRAGTEVTLYRVEGGGHTWPGRRPYLPRFLIGETNDDIDATAHILDFFARHAMPTR
ncbi:MAG: alpha/beta fold hydrolase [Alphaproteobacteria bacterium]|nr:alpha/beta fold hydrolase [Alphaproteobacteria bacterium]